MSGLVRRKPFGFTPFSTSVLLKQLSLTRQWKEEVGVKSCLRRLTCNVRRPPIFAVLFLFLLRPSPTICSSVSRSSLQSGIGTYGSRYTHSYSGRTSHTHTISFCYSLMSYSMKRILQGWSTLLPKNRGRWHRIVQLWEGAGLYLRTCTFIGMHEGWKMTSARREKKWLICLFLCAQHRTRVACGRCE